jgi:hypothetical protein
MTSALKSKSNRIRFKKITNEEKELERNKDEGKHDIKKLFNSEHLKKIKDLRMMIQNLCALNKDAFMEKCFVYKEKQR